MAKVLEIDATGARAASLAENREMLDRRQREEFGEDLSNSQQTPQSQWSGINAQALTEVGEEGVRAAQYGSSVDHSKGVHLDAHGSLLDIRRRVATHSRVTALLTGVAGTGVPAGARARTDPGRAEFRTVEDVVLSPSGVAVEMEAIEEGRVEAPAGTLTSIVTVIAGWESITNPAAAAVGIDRQTDEDYKSSYFVRTAHSSIGPCDALEAALEEAMTARRKVVENNRDTDRIIQEWTVGSHSTLAMVESGSDGDLRRAIENHRGMGSGTMSAIRAGDHNDTDLAAITDGTIYWNGTEYTGLDLSGLTTGAERAAALTTLLAADDVPPTITYIAGQYVAIFRWEPDTTPNFGENDDEDAFGFDPDSSEYPAGPFVRVREVELTIEFTVTRQAGFPADGLNQLREAVSRRVSEYDIGEQLWLNDILCAAEAIAGTRISALSVQANSADVSGVAVPLDQVWTLPAANLTITIS